jgi:TonB family protein
MIREHVGVSRPHSGGTTLCYLCNTTHPINPNSGLNRSNTAGTDGSENDDPFGEPTGSTCITGCIDFAKNDGPVPPPPAARHTLKIGHIDPAMLTERIEPVYPILPRQMRREGKVELRAMIATDGRIESLEVVSGDPLFYQSALDAVRRWKYRPTYLNGQAVEVDTFITVVYTLR